jgi:non-ribosomal peptide synthase protein (TIGR01720 family)/FkbM family methyltransferase
MFSLFAHLRCRRPRIFSFEPSPYAFAELRRNLERHGVDARLYAAGVADREGSAELTVYRRVSVMSGFHADAEAEERLFRDAFAAEGHGPGLAEAAAELAAGRFDGERMVRPLTTISAVIREHGVERIDLLKVDAEKSELAVLEGIEEVDWPKIRQILLEVHALGDRVERVRSLLSDHGFRVVVEEDPALAGTGIFHLHASRLPEVEPSAPPPLAEVAPPVELTADGLRDLLRRSLPDYLVPAHVVVLDRLPLNRNGKVDRAALPDPEAAAVAAYVPPSTPVERRLAEIWCQVLRREQVGVEENFFELGGDSILSIQVAAQARRAGLQLATRQLFQYQTIRELAAAVEEVAGPRIEAEQGLVSGPVPATPIQRWFYEERFADPHHFNQSLLLAVRARLDASVLHRAVARLVVHHDALRLRSTAEGQRIVAEAEAPFTAVDLSALPAERRTDAVTAAARALQGSLHLARGPLLRVAHFDFGAGEGRLLVVVHHLVMDGLSWRILLADLEAAYRDLAAGGRGLLPAKTTSFARWAARLEDHALSPEVAGELPFWLQQAGGGELPPDAAPAAPGPGRVESVSASLDADTTRALLSEVPSAYRAQVPELLVAALAGAVSRSAGVDDLGLVLEGHGREEVFPDVDLSRTLGWFTTHYPVRVRAPAAGGPGALLKAVKERLRTVPRGGLGYGLLRYLAPASPQVDELRDQPMPPLKLNYLGRFDGVLPPESPFAPAFEDRGRDRGRRTHRPYPLEVDVLVAQGRLQSVWTFDAGRYRRGRVEALAAAYLRELTALVEHCLSGEEAGYSPSDFPLAGLEQAALEEALLEADFELRGDP